MLCVPVGFVALAAHFLTTKTIGAGAVVALVDDGDGGKRWADVDNDPTTRNAYKKPRNMVGT